MRVSSSVLVEGISTALNWIVRPCLARFPLRYLRAIVGIMVLRGRRVTGRDTHEFDVLGRLLV